jgi:Concanavalin A-like lectin/glucanases superfamily
MKKSHFFAIFLLALFMFLSTLFMAACYPTKTSRSTDGVWSINSLNSVAGLPTQVEGNPQFIAETNSIRFDGDGDRLLVSNNPLIGAEEFTIEVVFKPEDAFPRNWEPRFFHIESEDNPNRRVTIELRLNNHKQWYLDAYIKSDNSQLTLIDSTKVHSTGQWFHAAITFKDKVLSSYVNGVKELEGNVEYLPIPQNAKTSIGARMNKIHWFKGEIKKIKITHKALSPADFMTL